MSDAWPSPDETSGPLPRIEDLPLADRGYEQEAVQAAFDAFYRHAAQLDSTLRTLEAVEIFRRDADALRNDLRAIRDAGGFGEREPAWATRSYELPRAQIPAVAFRLLFEAALIVAVAVIVGVAHLQSTLIVLLMAAAFAVVAFTEWLASRARWIAPAGGFVGGGYLEPAPYVEVAAWSAGPAQEPVEETGPEAALTMIAVDPWEADVAVEDDEPEPVAHGFFRRRRR
ncbi:MAG: hypothetical protein ABUS54_06300 [Actinomycetota bacterium]